MYGVNLDDMGEDERNTPHIRLRFHLLVMQNASYSEFKVVDNNWAWARKVTISPVLRRPPEVQGTARSEWQSWTHRFISDLADWLKHSRVL